MAKHMKRKSLTRIKHVGKGGKRSSLRIKEGKEPPCIDLSYSQSDSNEVLKVNDSDKPLKKIKMKTVRVAKQKKKYFSEDDDSDQDTKSLYETENSNSESESSVDDRAKSKRKEMGKKPSRISKVAKQSDDDDSDTDSDFDHKKVDDRAKSLKKLGKKPSKISKVAELSDDDDSDKDSNFTHTKVDDRAKSLKKIGKEPSRINKLTKLSDDDDSDKDSHFTHTKADERDKPLKEIRMKTVRVAKHRKKYISEDDDSDNDTESSNETENVNSESKSPVHKRHTSSIKARKKPSRLSNITKKQKNLQSDSEVDMDSTCASERKIDSGRKPYARRGRPARKVTNAAKVVESPLSKDSDSDDARQDNESDKCSTYSPDEEEYNDTHIKRKDKSVIKGGRKSSSINKVVEWQKKQILKQDFLHSKDGNTDSNYDTEKDNNDKSESSADEVNKSKVKRVQRNPSKLLSSDGEETVNADEVNKSKGKRGQRNPSKLLSSDGEDTVNADEMNKSKVKRVQRNPSKLLSSDGEDTVNGDVSEQDIFKNVKGLNKSINEDEHDESFDLKNNSSKIQDSKLAEVTVETLNSKQIPKQCIVKISKVDLTKESKKRKRSDIDDMEDDDVKATKNEKREVGVRGLSVSSSIEMENSFVVLADVHKSPGRGSNLERTPEKSIPLKKLNNSNILSPGTEIKELQPTKIDRSRTESNHSNETFVSINGSTLQWEDSDEEDVANKDVSQPLTYFTDKFIHDTTVGGCELKHSNSVNIVKKVSDLETSSNSSRFTHDSLYHLIKENHCNEFDTKILELKRTKGRTVITNKCKLKQCIVRVEKLAVDELCAEKKLQSTRASSESHTASHEEKLTHSPDDLHIKTEIETEAYSTDDQQNTKNIDSSSKKSGNVINNESLKMSVESDTTCKNYKIKSRSQIESKNNSVERLSPLKKHKVDNLESSDVELQNSINYKSFSEMKTNNMPNASTPKLCNTNPGSSFEPGSTTKNLKSNNLTSLSDSESTIDEIFLTQSSDIDYTFKSRSGIKYAVSYFIKENVKNMLVTVKWDDHPRKPSKSKKSVLPQTCRYGCKNVKYSCIHWNKISKSEIDSNISNEIYGIQTNTASLKHEHRISEKYSKSCHSDSRIHSEKRNSSTEIREQGASEGTSHKSCMSSDENDDSNVSIRSRKSDLFCVQCMAKFSDMLEHYNHTCMGKREKGYLCKYCEKVFSSYQPLKKHKKKHDISK